MEEEKKEEGGKYLSIVIDSSKKNKNIGLVRVPPGRWRRRAFLTTAG